MTYQEYFNQADFEDIWYVLYFYYLEDIRIKPYYKAIVDVIKNLKIKAKYSKETIVFHNEKNIRIEGAPDPQEWLVGREVKIICDSDNIVNTDSKIIDQNKSFLSLEGVPGSYSQKAAIAAHLIFWSTLYSFKTHTQHVKDFVKYFKDKENNIPRLIKFQESFVTDSYRKKKILFWREIIEKDNPISWQYNLFIIKKKLEYNIGYWRFVQRHVGWEEEVNRMKICCNLLDAAAKDYLSMDEHGIYINSANASRYGLKMEDGDLKQFSLEKLRQEKAFHIVWKYIDHNMNKWWD